MMPNRPFEIAVFGLSITSSWGNGHATTYRSLLAGLHRLGHNITFFERDMPWYAQNRDMPVPPFCRTVIYNSIGELEQHHLRSIACADMVIVGSYVPQGIELGKLLTDSAKGVTAFYDIDTPVTVSKLKNQMCEYITRELVTRYNLYLSFTGGPILSELQRTFGAPSARPLYCSVDTSCYYPQNAAKQYDMGYIGTYSSDRQNQLEELMLKPARATHQNRFVIAGPQYPEDIVWPRNLHRIYHLPPDQHAFFYNSQRFTLNITRSDMISAGFSPSVRLFEAAACGTPIISDYWPGLESFFEPDREILVANSSLDITDKIFRIPECDLERIRQRALACILNGHTSLHRASQLLTYFEMA